MSARFAALVAALLAVLAVPAAAGANPSVGVSIASTTNLSRLPATVTHRLTLTAGAQDEQVSLRATGRGFTLGGSAVATDPPTAIGGGLSACPGRWSLPHNPRGSNVTSTVGLRIPAGTTGWVDLPVTLTEAPYLDEDLDAEFDVTPAEGAPYTVLSRAPSYAGPTAPEMSLFVLRGVNRSTVLTGQAAGASGGRVEIFGYAPGRTRATRLKSVAVGENGTWSWASWAPARAGRWELYTRYRRSARASLSGATTCGVQIRIGG